MTSHIVPNLVIAPIAGGSAGDHTVTGIKVTDKLLAVMHWTPTTLVPANLLSEFTISAADTINNDGGTDTSSDFLVVFYIAAHEGGGDLNRS
jgi:beta-galactosidase GanA